MTGNMNYIWLEMKHASITRDPPGRRRGFFVVCKGCLRNRSSAPATENLESF